MAKSKGQSARLLVIGLAVIALAAGMARLIETSFGKVR